MRQKFPVVILAGSPIKRDPLMDYADVDYKALIVIDNKTLLNYVLEAIINSKIASFILIVGMPPEAENKVTLPKGFDRELIEFLYIEGAVVNKIQGAGARLLEIGKKNPQIFTTEGKHTLFITGDIPTITVPAIHDFIDEIQKPEADGYLTAVEQKIMEAKFPGNNRSWVHVKGGLNYCVGDVNLLKCNLAVERYELIKLLSESRKLLIKGLFKLSPLFFIKYIFRRIAMKDAEEILTKLFEMDMKVIVSKHAEIAMDVDKPHQLDMTREYITKIHKTGTN